MLQQGQRARYLPQLAAAHDNLRAALLWACTHDSEAACRLVRLLRLFWFYGDRMAEGELWSQRVLALPAPAPVTQLTVTQPTVTPPAIGVILSLLCYAELHRRQGQLDLAVRLLAHATRRPILFPFDAAISERTLAAARSQLPAAEFATAWAAGQALTLAEALALARPPLVASEEQAGKALEKL